MTIEKIAGNDNYTHFADFYQPFLIDECHVKGSFIRLGKAVDIILHRHNYPEAVSELLAEQMVLACMLSGNLQEGGSLTVQVKGSGGPVKFAVVDVNASGEIRGYAELTDDAKEQIRLIRNDKKQPVLRDFVGDKGYLTINMLSSSQSQQYQGIVALNGRNLSDALSGYFTQSEQIQVSIRVAVGQNTESNKKRSWYASGMMIQRVPSEGGKKAGKARLEEEQEQWNRAEILMSTVRDKELLDPHLPAQTLLLRLFNEDGVWVYEPKQLDVGCRCSRERVKEVLGTFPPEDLEDMKVDGVISVNCQFCNKTEVFREKEISKMQEQSSQ